jgi:calcium/calmodulin-dependent protein kinase I
MSLIEDHYEICEDVLGKGYFAVVHVGIDLVTKEKVAIKCVDKSMVERQETLEMEKLILQSITHENIVKMISLFETDSYLFIVMELMEGGELYEEIIRRKSFTEGDASYIMRQLFKALDYLHERNIVHRDLKLENLLLVRKNAIDIKLADFGLSKLYTDKKLQTACGTPFYVAPEIVLGEGYGPEVDMWAAGIILYVLLSGRLPFAAENENDLYKLIISGNLVFKTPQFDNVSDLAKDIISKLLDIETENRLNAKQALMHNFVAGNGVDNEKPLHKSVNEKLKKFKSKKNINQTRSDSH